MDTLSFRRLAENEAYFRQQNEQIQKGFDEINKVAKELGDEQLTYDTQTPLHLYCECSDKSCRQRIRISLEVYNDIHLNRNAFVVVPGHEVAEIERVTATEPAYNVVEKIKQPQS